MKMRGILMRDTGKERGLLLFRRNYIAVYQKNDMLENLEVRSVMVGGVIPSITQLYGSFHKLCTRWQNCGVNDAIPVKVMSVTVKYLRKQHVYSLHP